MRGRSRYAYRYDEFEQNQVPISVSQPEFLAADSHFLNIANGQCGSVTVSCWPTREGLEGGRTWGKLGPTDAAILPFRTRAETTCSVAKLETFELELFFGELDPQGFGPSSFPDICHIQQSHLHAAIRLVDLPAPVYVTQSPATDSPQDTAADHPWTFRSKEIQNCDGLARAARWTWDANGHESVILHGGVAFEHVKKPFVVACRVRGKAFTELPTKACKSVRIRYRFSNEGSAPKWWTMIPQSSSEDLTHRVQQLEATMQILNTKPHGASSACTSPEMNSSQSHSFGGTTISGSAQVVMGNVYHGTSPDSFHARTTHSIS